MTTAHHLQTLKFELEIPLLSKNKDIQDQVNSTFNSQFTSMLNEVFTFYGNDEDIIIESITLDLNPIVLSRFKTDLVRQTHEHLVAYFEKYKLREKLNNGAASYQVKANSTTFHPLLYFLFHGVGSWASKDFQAFDKSWQNQLKNAGFVLHLQSISWQMNAITRLVYHLEEPLLYQTIEKIIQSDASYIKVHHDMLTVLFTKGQLSKSGSANSLKQKLWITTLNFILVKNSGSFSKIDYSAYHLTQLATAGDLDIQELTNNLLLALKEVKTVNSLTTAYGHIIKTMHEKIPPVSSEKEFNSKTSIESIEKLLFKADQSKEDISFIKKWMLTPANRKLMHHSWVAPLREHVLDTVVTILAPTGTKFILIYHYEILKEYANQPTATSKESLKKAIWSFTLDYLTTSFSSTFQAREFVFSHTRKISNRNGIDYAVFLRSLLSSVRSLSENRVKYHQLLQILKALADEHPGFEQFNSRSTIDLLKVDEILNNPGSKIPVERIRLRRWLLNKNNWEIIKNKWINNHDESQVQRIIEIISPEKCVFIEQSIVATIHLFKHSNLLKNNAVSFRKFLYTQVIAYFQANPTNFNKTEFVNLQIRSVLGHLNLNYRIFLIHYRGFLGAYENSPLRPLEYFTILNQLQHTLEKNYKGIYVQADFDENDLTEIFEYLETGKTRKNHPVLKTPDFKKFQDALEQLLVDNPGKWFDFLLAKAKPLQIHQSVFQSFSTSLLRNIVVFQTHYDTLSLLQKKLGRQITIPLQSTDLTLLFYLEEGFFPAWVSRATEQAIKNSVISKKTGSLLLLYHWSPNAIHNWVTTISVEYKRNALKKWTRDETNHSLFCLFVNLDQIYKNMDSFHKRHGFISFEKSFWTIFFGLTKQNDTISSSHFMALFFKEWKQQFKVNIFASIESRKLLQSGLYLPSLLSKVSEKIKSDAPNAEKETRTKLITNEQPKDRALKKQVNEPVVNLTKWYMENAGLIIAHPFLPLLFKYLNYLNDESQFKDEQTGWKAVYLLHYLATGQVSDIDESGLAMPKILCGILIECPVPPGLILSKNEVGQADEVLQVIISRWDKLGKTSNEGLRSTFLKRKGILEEKNDAFQLSIETSGFDILLDYIPWNIAIVKLPWIKNIIYTSWR
jgi:hypothetical protein